MKKDGRANYAVKQAIRRQKRQECEAGEGQRGGETYIEKYFNELLNFIDDMEVGVSCLRRRGGEEF